MSRSPEEWDSLRRWEARLATRLAYRWHDAILYRGFEHDPAPSDGPCPECESLMLALIKDIRVSHEIRIHSKIEDLLNVTCSMSHPGGD